MLDHVFLDSVEALRQALDDTLLARAPHEDRLSSDLLLGDLAWETSVSLPGDGDPPRVRTDITLDWTTWSQSAWRSMAFGEIVDEPPEIGVEVVFRIQRLARRPSLELVLSVLPDEAYVIGPDALERSGPVIEEAMEDLGGPSELAVEVVYEGSYRLASDPRTPAGADRPSPRPTGPVSLDRLSSPAQLAAGAARETLAALGAWVASTLVRLGDLQLDFVPDPPDTE